jgi:hypothetical protein
MIEILQILFGIVVSAICLRGLWESSVMLSYRSQLRKITGGYYDFEIDEVLAEWGMTREEALREHGFLFGDKKIDDTKV